MPFCFIFLFKTEIHLAEFVLEHFILMIHSLADLVELLILFTEVINVFFLSITFLAQFSNLNFVVICIYQLSLILLGFDSENLDFLG